MAFPTIPSTAGTTLAGLNQLNTTATLTGPVLGTAVHFSAGDLLIAIAGEYQSSAASNASYTSWAGGGLSWTGINVTDNGTAACRLGVAYARAVTGSETGAVTVTRAGTLVGDASMIIMVISGVHATAAPEATVVAYGTGTAAPATLTPSWGADDTLWIGANGNGDTSATGSATFNNGAPTNYTGFFGTNPTDTSVIGDFGLAVAFRQNHATSETMGTFSQDTSNARDAVVLIAVRPPLAPLALAGTATSTSAASGAVSQTVGLAGTASNPVGVPGSWSNVQSCHAIGTAGGGAGTCVTGAANGGTDWPSNLSSGTKLIAYVTNSWGTPPGVPTSVKDAALNAFTHVVTIDYQGEAATSIWILDTPAGDVGAKPLITATFTNSFGSNMIVEEVSGLLAGNTASVLDGTAGTANGTTSPATSGAYSSTAANEFLVGVVGDGGYSATYTLTGFTADSANPSPNANAGLFVGYKNSSNGSESLSWAFTSNPKWGTILAAFQLAIVTGLQAANGDITNAPAGGTTWAVAGTAPTTSAASGTLIFSVEVLAGTATSASTASGAFTPQTLAGTAASASVGTGTIGLRIPAAGTASTISAASGAFTPQTLAGTAATTSIGSGQVTLTPAVIAGAASTASTASGAFTPQSIAGTSASTSAGSGTLTLTIAVTGTASSASSASGSLLFAPAVIAGTAASASSASGGFTPQSLAGTAADISAASGTLRLIMALAGTTAAASTANGSFTPASIAGTASDTSVTAGDITSGTGPTTWSAAGTASGTSAASGALVSTLILTGSAATASAASGSFTPAAISGTAAGASAATGAFTAALLAGTSSAASAASGAITSAAGPTTWSAAGTASDISQASGALLPALIASISVTASVASGSLTMKLTTTGTMVAVMSASGSLSLSVKITGTAQLSSSASGSFTSGVILGTVTGTIFNWDTTPRTGLIIFETMDFAIDAPDSILYPSYSRSVAVLGVTSIIAQENAAVSGPPVPPGSFSIALLVTDFAGGSPVYRVTYDLDGIGPRVVKNYLLPKGQALTDLSQLAEVAGL